MLRRYMLAFALAAGGLLNGLGVASACGLDGVPSLLANGRLVAVNRVQPLQGQVTRWAPFVAPGVFPVGRPVLLSENRGRVLWTLPPSAFETPWRWTFGDGAQARGLTARHSYRHAGDYVIGVRAYLVDGPNSGWFLFDTTLIHVR
jgi:PKD domain-containing protein